MLGLTTCPDLRPKMQQASSEVVRVAPSQKPKGYEYRIFGCRHARANQTNDLYACVLQQGKSRSVPKINALEEAMEIILTEEEVRIARYIAKQKVDFSGANNYDSKKRDERSHLEITAQGLSAEMAVAKHLNVYPDLDARYSPYDLIYNGFKINVKSTIADHHDLLIPDYQQSRSDFYILVTGKVPVLNIRGVATSGMIYNDQNMVDLGKGVCYRLKQNQLIPFWDWSNA